MSCAQRLHVSTVGPSRDGFTRKGGIRYKVSGVMCSASACEHCWSIEGWIHSKRRNRLHQTLVEKLVRAHTNLVLRGSLDDALHHLLPWDIELIIDEPVDQTEEEPEV